MQELLAEPLGSPQDEKGPCVHKTAEPTGSTQEAAAGWSSFILTLVGGGELPTLAGINNRLGPTWV